jgi:hypothetical protein
MNRGETYEGTIMNSWKAKRPPACDLGWSEHCSSLMSLEKIPSIENIHERNRKNVRLLSARKIRNVSVERNLLISLEMLSSGPAFGI